MWLSTVLALFTGFSLGMLLMIFLVMARDPVQH